MKMWKKYEYLLLNGEWHAHTSYTDGKNTVFEMCSTAKELNLPLIAFTEHVRRKLNYDFSKFLGDIENAREMFPDMIILSGVEAKVLPDCTLDVEDKILKEVDYPIFAFHSFPKDYELYIECLKKIISKKEVNTWAHPGLFLKKYRIDIELKELKRIFIMMKEHDVLLELNGKYSLPQTGWIDLAKSLGVRMVRGNDVHSIQDLLTRSKL